MHAALGGDPYVLVGVSGLARQSQDRVAVPQQALCGGVHDLLGHRVGRSGAARTSARPSLLQPGRVARHRLVRNYSEESRESVQDHRHRGGVGSRPSARSSPTCAPPSVVTHSPTVASSKKIGAASRFAVLPLAGVAGVVTDAGGENAAVRSLGAPLIRA
ncbi:hypothetical protein [Nonomuraea bangladeshensis]|uniref:hypothetical protein n=1 Tax=Nonomuraea bangladeshensis TaxID=404385 RepID=UPI003C2EAB00